jgi:pyridoxamine 5'-phosphate oxidase
LKELSDIRQDYLLAALDETIVGDDPIIFFTRWFAEAQKAEITEVNAMTLATVGMGNKPHARIVLLKGLEDGQFQFFTNYNSGKGLDISHNPHVSLVFFWKELERQVRIEGRASVLPADKSDAYFYTRPEGSRLGAWASPQSTEITDRSILDTNYIQYENQFQGTEIPRPGHWGGYAIDPAVIEFWQGRSNRMHDRIVFTKTSDGMWKKKRLAP